MRAITPEDLALVSPQGTVEPDTSTVTISHNPPPPPMSSAPPTSPPPTAPPGPPPCLPNAVRTNPQLTMNNEVSNPNSPAITQGTVPGGGTGVGANSGVTVSYGFDLAYHYASNLTTAGLAPSVIDQLRPFLATQVVLPSIVGLHALGIAVLGARGTDANTLLLKLPIEPPLSAADVSNLFNYAYGIAQNKAQTDFESMTSSSLLALPCAAQSVLTDLAYNFGNLNALPAPLKQAIAAQDWSALATLIQQDIGATRGTQDAAVLQRAISSGALATSGACKP